MEKKILKIEPKICKRCYGKGYSTEYQGNQIGLADFIGDRDYLYRKEGISIELCDCQRAKDLKTFFYIKKKFK